MIFHGLMKPVVCEHRQSFQVGFLDFLTQSHNFLAGAGKDWSLFVVNVYDLLKDGKQGD